MELMSRLAKKLLEIEKELESLKLQSETIREHLASSDFTEFETDLGSLEFKKTAHGRIESPRLKELQQELFTHQEDLLRKNAERVYEVERKIILFQNELNCLTEDEVTLEIREKITKEEQIIKDNKKFFAIPKLKVSISKTDVTGSEEFQEALSLMKLTDEYVKRPQVVKLVEKFFSEVSLGLFEGTISEFIERGKNG